LEFIDGELNAISSSPWHATINDIEVSNWGFVLEERTLSEPARVSLDNIGVKVDNLSNKKDTKTKVGIALIESAGKMNPMNAFQYSEAPKERLARGKRHRR
jgi:hypothetical protein